MGQGVLASCSLSVPGFRGIRPSLAVTVPCLPGWITVVDLDPEAGSFFGVDLTETVQGTAAGAVDHFFRAAGLRAEIAGLVQGTVPAHATAKKKGLDQLFPKGVQAAGSPALVGAETDCPGQGKDESLRLEYGVVDLLIDQKEGRWCLWCGWLLSLFGKHIPGGWSREVHLLPQFLEVG